MRHVVSPGFMFVAIFFAMTVASPTVGAAAEPVALRDRREPLVDTFLIDKLVGEAERRLHRPTAREVVLRTDEPWEGNTCGYFTIFRDDEKYRMYYRGSQHSGGKAHHEVVCYAESDDGIHWRKPELGLVEFDGSKKNNIIWDGIGVHAFVPFKDANPDATAEAKYKAVGRGRPHGKKGLYVLKSPDGLRWQLMHDQPVITPEDIAKPSAWAFDSQNLAFWDGDEETYRVYYRVVRPRRVRDIQTAASDDMLNWLEPKWLEYPGAEPEQLYTNQVMPHPRAPHVLIGFPSRYLPDREDMVEGLLMCSRDRVTFHRWSEALIPPGPGAGRWQNRSNYIWWGLVETESHLDGAPPEWSLYVNEDYYRGDSTRIRRYTIRKDGFVSIRAPMAGGSMITRPLTFEGDRLTLNVATSAAGAVRVELQRPTASRSRALRWMTASRSTAIRLTGRCDGKAAPTWAIWPESRSACASR